MLIRPEVYSPLQNTAVWLAAWLYGYESTDETMTALGDLGGPHHYRGEGLTSLLYDARTSADLEAVAPVVRLILWGPGQASGVRPGSPASKALTSAGALVISGRDGLSHILVPSYDDDGVQWRWFEEPERLPEPSWLSPGEADSLLVQATNESATLIEAVGGASTTLPDPRLTVGTLTDFYDTPRLPRGVTPRAAKLFARADRAGDHSLDLQLFALWRHVRTARMAGVVDAVRDYRRDWQPGF